MVTSGVMLELTVHDRNPFPLYLKEKIKHIWLILVS